MDLFEECMYNLILEIHNDFSRKNIVVMTFVLFIKIFKKLIKIEGFYDSFECISVMIYIVT